MGTIYTGQTTAPSLKQAQEHCRRLTRHHYENFTVGSLLLPKEKRRHVDAIYAFCRTVDNLGDEAPGDRLKLLTWWEEELARCYQGVPVHPVTVALQETVNAFHIPSDPFVKLIAANRMDQMAKRHATYQDLLHYCDHSANPVGRLVLYLFGYRDEQRQMWSDNTCTALQLTNFWQDVKRDHAMGRIYIPSEDLERFNYSEENLTGGVANNNFRHLMAFEVERTRELFRAGLPLLSSIRVVPRLEVALFTLGGLAVLGAIQRQRYDVLSRRPALSKLRKGWLLFSALASTVRHSSRPIS